MLQKLVNGVWVDQSANFNALASSNEYSTVRSNVLGEGTYRFEYSVNDLSGSGSAQLRIDNVILVPQIHVDTGAVDIVNTADELQAALQGGSSSVDLNTAGADTINGGDGNDIIFGDAPFTDALALAHGLTDMPAGSGWKVFQTLEATPSQNWTREDTIDYLRDPANHSVLSQESGRSGGNDTIHGGAGNDIIFGQEGNDLIDGGAGADTMSGGSGADTFVISADTLGSINDLIVDYNPGQGDQIDLSELLSGLAAGTNLEASGYVKIEQNGANAELKVDVDGSAGNAHGLETVAVLQNYTFTDSSEAVKVLFEDSSHVKHSDAI